MSDVYCPMAAMHAERMPCVKFEDYATCYECPMDTLRSMARSMGDMVDITYNNTSDGIESAASALYAIARAIQEGCSEG